ncbi:MAG: FAD:protein FMN transferase [Bacteroidia bacterium]|nr:FAD:protein FMN transferase [Bacteroidia bacterium]
MSWLCGLCMHGLQSQPLSRMVWEHRQMGTTFRIVLYSDDSLRAAAAVQAAFARVDTLNAILSDYLPGSELNRLCAQAGSGSWTPVSRDLWRVLRASQEIAARSGGAFDLSIGPLSRLWRRGIRRQELPDSQQIEAARQLVDYRQIRLRRGRQAQLGLPGMQLDPGGIGQGYAADEAWKVLRKAGYAASLVDAGGDIFAGAPPPGRPGWEVEVTALDSLGQPWQRSLFVRNCGITTSGDTYRYVEYQGRRYSHIIDPRSGLGAERQRKATVLAPDCTRADVLATTLCILGPESGFRVLDRMLRRGPRAATLIETDGPRLRQYSWRSFPASGSE